MLIVFFENLVLLLEKIRFRVIICWVLREQLRDRVATGLAWVVLGRLYVLFPAQSLHLLIQLQDLPALILVFVCHAIPFVFKSLDVVF